MAFDGGELALQSSVDIRFPVGTIPPRGWVPPVAEEGEPEYQPGDTFRLRTTLGRALFNELLPEDYPFVDYSVGKKQLSEIVNDLAERYPKVIVAATLDNLKAAGFHWATRSGVTVSVADIVVPEAKKAIVKGYEEQDEKVQKQYERGLITKDERTQEPHRDLDQGDQRGCRGDERELPQDQPHLHDG